MNLADFWKWACQVEPVLPLETAETAYLVLLGRIYHGKFHWPENHNSHKMSGDRRWWWVQTLYTDLLYSLSFAWNENPPLPFYFNLNNSKTTYFPQILKNVSYAGMFPCKGWTKQQTEKESNKRRCSRWCIGGMNPRRWENERHWAQTTKDSFTS